MCIDKTTGKTTLKFKEMISSGRTGTMSATGFMGVISGILTLVTGFALIVFYFIKPGEAGNILELLDRVIVVFSISAGLLGVRKISGVIGNKQYSAETTDEYRTKTIKTVNTLDNSNILNE